MNANTQRRILGALLAFSASWTAASSAQAVECSSLPTPVYVTGATGAKPLLAKLGAALAKGSSPITIVYKGQGSCAGLDAVLSSTGISGTATYWSAEAQGDLTCDLALTGSVVDVAMSDVFVSTCNVQSPADVRDFQGPVQVMNFVVPKGSSQVNISAEAAYLVFGLGSLGQVAPWTDENLIIRRNDTSGTQLMTGAAIGAPASKWKGIDAGSSGEVLKKVAASVEPEKTIGILGSELTDENRDKITQLAYQHSGQTCGFFPDSSSTSFDKRNVRDGHYPIWGPLHLIARVDGQGAPLSAPAAEVIGYMTGALDAPTGLDMIEVEASVHTVPACAMRVVRTEELGALASYAAPEPCHCQFEKVVSGSTSCTTCSDNAGCSAPTPYCRHGYCEAY